jgi:hypothetical protein
MFIFFAAALCYAVVLFGWMLRVRGNFISQGFTFAVESGLLSGLIVFMAVLSMLQLFNPLTSSSGSSWVALFGVMVVAVLATALLTVLHRSGPQRLHSIEDDEVPAKTDKA